MDATYLLPLLDEVASLAMPGEIHPAVWSVDESTEAWGRRAGLITGDPDCTPLGRARFGRLAARSFPAAGRDRVELFGRWLIWLFTFDDARDEGPLGGSATAVGARYGELMQALRRGHALPGADPLETALSELWHETAGPMSPDWRYRFLAHMEEHRIACTEEAVARRTGRVAAQAEYPALRRRTTGLFMFDLAEPVVGCELPADLVRSPAWQDLLHATADLLAWSNDVASYRQETHAQTNYLTVLAHSYGMAADQTVTWVVGRIAERAPEAVAAARRLPGEFARLGLDGGLITDATAIAEVLLNAPRAHVEWLQETGRYSAGIELPPRRETLLARAGVPGAGVPVPTQSRRSAHGAVAAR